MSIGRITLWLVLAVPGALMLRDLSGGTLPFKLYHPSGEMAVRLMLLALLVGPLADIFGRRKFLLLWLKIRRNLGVAAFFYGCLHLVFYFIDMQSLAAMLDELALPAIWTGWLSFALMLVAASISTDWAVRRLGRWWPVVQKGVYPAYLLAILHWWLLAHGAVPAIIHLVPLILVWTARIIVRRVRKTGKKGALA